MIGDWTEGPPQVAEVPKPAPQPTQARGSQSTATQSTQSGTDTKPLPKPWDRAAKQLWELDGAQQIRLLEQCRMLGMYLVARLEKEANSVELPKHDNSPIPTLNNMLKLMLPPLPANNEPVEATVATLCQSLGLDQIIREYEGMVTDDLLKAKRHSPPPLGAEEDSHRPLHVTLLSLRRHQAYLSILLNIFDLLFSNPEADPVILVQVPDGDPLHLIISGRPTRRPMAPPRSRTDPRNLGRPAVVAPGPAVAGPVAGAPPFDPAALPGNPLRGGPHTRLRAGAAVNPDDRMLGLHLNLDELRRALIPFLWLSLKLSFFLWIFGRHAAPEKRIALFFLAGLCVLWETWAFRTRRAAEIRRQVQQAYQRERAATNQNIDEWNQQRPAHLQIPHVGPLQDNAIEAPAVLRMQINPRGGRQQGRRPPLQMQGGQLLPVGPHHGMLPRPSPPPRSRRSRWTSSYWISKVAGVGLSAEARETGLRALLHRRDNLGLTEANVERYTTPVDESRWMQRLRTSVVLLFGSLIPEVERKRRRALEKRDRVLRELKAECEKQEKELADLLAKAEAEEMDNASTTAEPDHGTNRPLSRDLTMASAGDTNTANIVNSLLDTSRAATPDPQPAAAVEERLRNIRQRPPAEAEEGPAEPQPQEAFVDFMADEPGQEQDQPNFREGRRVNNPREEEEGPLAQREPGAAQPPGNQLMMDMQDEAPGEAILEEGGVPVGLDDIEEDEEERQPPGDEGEVNGMYVHVFAVTPCRKLMRVCSILF